MWKNFHKDELIRIIDGHAFKLPINWLAEA